MANCKKTRKEKKYPATTNYPPDPHHIFCDRCYAHNKYCVMSGRKRRDWRCTI